jgi:aspartyl/asparaginyl-tRNA synthetase
MDTILIKDILSLAADGRKIVVRGWVRTKRDSKISSSWN